MHARINESYRTYEESVNKFCKNLEITPYTIYKNQINRDDPSNLLAWADSLDNLTKHNKVYFLYVLSLNLFFRLINIENFPLLVGL